MKCRGGGRQGGGGGEVLFRLSGPLMCLCPAESKEIENLSVVPGGLGRHTCRRNKQKYQSKGGYQCRDKGQQRGIKSRLL